MSDERALSAPQREEAMARAVTRLVDAAVAAVRKNGLPREDAGAALLHAAAALYGATVSDDCWDGMRAIALAELPKLLDTYRAEAVRALGPFGTRQ